jgi:hypothetical protein
METLFCGVVAACFNTLALPMGLLASAVLEDRTNKNMLQFSGGLSGGYACASGIAS